MLVNARTTGVQTVVIYGDSKISKIDCQKCGSRATSLRLFCIKGRRKAPLGDAKFVMEILGDKNKEVEGGQISLCFKGK